jgi:macrolide transport system ATP-binding/permease protein
MLLDLIQDFRYGARNLRRSPGFTVLVVLSLALGIGANAAIFNLINAVFLRPMPVRDPGGLVRLSEERTSGRAPARPGSDRVTNYSFPLYQRLAAENRIFAGLAAVDGPGGGGLVRWRGVVDEEIPGAYGHCVSHNYFDVLGVPAYRGRAFLPVDASAAGAPVVMFSHGFWQRRFAGDPAVIGARVSVGEQSYTVVGVTPPGFAGTRVLDESDFWMPFSQQAEWMCGQENLSRSHWFLMLLGRLAPGASLTQAQAAANVTLGQFLAEGQTTARTHDGFDPRPVPRNLRIVIEPGAQGFSNWRQGQRVPLTVLMVGAGLLLLIVCLNVTHLLLARASKRQRELGIRAALGASRARLLRQFLTEGLLLAGLGAIAGAVASRWLSDGLLALAATEQMLRGMNASADGRVLTFTATVAIATALIIGLLPAWQASSARADLDQILRGASHALAGPGSRRLVSRVLLTSQVALSVVLLVGAGLLTTTLSRLRGIEKGVDTAGVVLAALSPDRIGVGDQQAAAFQRELLRHLQAQPGVRHAGLAEFQPLGGSNTPVSILLPGRDSQRTDTERVTPGYFEAVGMTVVRGRGLSRDDHQGAARVVVANQAWVRRFFPEGEVLGLRFRFDQLRSRPAVPSDVFEVVGVVQDVKDRNLRLEARPILYFSSFQWPKNLGVLAVRAAAGAAGGDLARLGDQIRVAVRAAYPGLPVRNVRTLDGEVDRSLRRDRLLATLSTGFGAAALFLVSLGLFGVISQWATQRTREIGVRVALGATARAVRWMVLRQAFVLVLAGVVLGVPAAVLAARLLQGVLYGISPTDPLTLTGAALALFGVATIAAYLPARRASRVDPMVALRSE